MILQAHHTSTSLSNNNTPKKLKIHSRYDKGFPRYFIEEYMNAPVFDSLYTLVRHYQRVPFSVEKSPLILKRPIEEPRSFAKETWVFSLSFVLQPIEILMFSFQ